MRDLRKKVLVQSGKTQSRKARAREERTAPETDDSSPGSSPRGSPRGSPLSSRAGSRNNSRPGSRYASEDEEDINNNLDNISETAEGDFQDDGFFDDDDTEDQWAVRLRNRISQLGESRERNVSERELTLVGYLHLIRQHYAQHVVEEFLDDIILPSLFNSIKRAASEKELIAALNALSATLITCPAEEVYDRISKSLKTVCEESEYRDAKVAAMNALVVTVALGGGMGPDFQDILEYLLEVVESDGQTVDAEDDGVVVTGALRAWGFVASFVAELAETTEDGRAMDAFIEQLNSTDAQVQISAGYNIAHIFEAARIQEKKSRQDFGLQHNQHLVLTRMREIVTEWSKATAKKDRRLRRGEFPSIIISIERRVGPGYIESKGENPRHHSKNSSSQLQELKASFAGFNKDGLQKKDRLQKGGLNKARHSVIDDWKCHARLEVFKHVLAAGIEMHWLENPIVAKLLTKMHSASDDDDDEYDEEEDEDDEVEFAGTSSRWEGVSEGRSRIDRERGLMMDD